MSAKEIKNAFPTETALCECFIRTLSTIDGWTVYPETGGFDILAVYKTGHQLGIEAKLHLNAKIADQIVPDDYYARYGAKGPDFRAVIVPAVTEASEGIAKLLHVLGVMVWMPGQELQPPDYRKNIWSFEQALRARQSFGAAIYDAEESRREDERDERFGWCKREYILSELRWHDWNPAKRCELPECVPQVPAGVPAPLRLTPWKIGALKVLADIEIDGFVTAKSVRAHGIDPRRFCASDGWLQSLGGGKWVRGSIPAFDQQHPEAYAEILGKARAATEKAA